VDTPVEDDAPSTIEQNGQTSSDEQASTGDVESASASPALSRAGLNQGSGISVAHIPEEPPESSSGSCGMAEQSVIEPVELETSAERSDAPMHDSQPMVRPELGQAEEMNNPNLNQGETSTDGSSIVDSSTADLR
jgi:hypothetical protein